MLEEDKKSILQYVDSKDNVKHVWLLTFCGGVNLVQHPDVQPATHLSPSAGKGEKMRWRNA